MENKVKNKPSVLEMKTIQKYYLDGEEITQSDFKAIQKCMKLFCKGCSQANAQENFRLEQYSGSYSGYSASGPIN